MKQRKVVSMIGVLVVMISTVAFITGCQQANGGKSGNGDILKKDIIEFLLQKPGVLFAAAGYNAYKTGIKGLRNQLGNNL